MEEEIKSGKKELTVSQSRVFRELKRFIEKNGYPPTNRELGDILGMKAPSVHEQLRRLEEKKYISRKRHQARSIDIIYKESTAGHKIQGVKELCRVPVLGRIAAGNPVFAQENYEGEVLADSNLAAGARLFALIVTGDSMMDADINDGDMVIVRQQPAAESGDIVAAMIDDEATVKRLKITGSQVLLMPENPSYKQIDVTMREDFRILGRVVGMARLDY